MRLQAEEMPKNVTESSVEFEPTQRMSGQGHQVQCDRRESHRKSNTAWARYAPFGSSQLCATSGKITDVIMGAKNVSTRKY
jgi:hypothetical protein